MKVVINRSYGGFGLSEAAMTLYKSLSASEVDYDWQIDRGDPHLVRVVEELGPEAGGDCSALKVVEIPDGVPWEIQEYDGLEWVAEKHRTWY